MTEELNDVVIKLTTDPEYGGMLVSRLIVNGVELHGLFEVETRNAAEEMPIISLKFATNKIKYVHEV